ncbi:MAG: hypothetical protein OXG87_00075 [Gemmatimonadetes bacterium]|nr:hypothetical protein [Gemmatimonadota bacterium]
MDIDQWLENIRRAIGTLPIQDNKVFQELWNNKLLRYGGEDPDPLEIDALSTALACTCLKKRKPFLVVLPDRNPARPALLFATGLILDAISSEKGQKVQIVLYAGSHIGIRDQLANVYARKLRLDEVFVQSHASSRNTKVQSADDIANSLPRVATVYAPADPRIFLDEYRPDWIAVDCGDSNNLKWLDALLSSAVERNIPIVGWCQNSLSDTVQTFSVHGAYIFRWPSVQQLSSAQNKVESSNALISAICLEGPDIVSVETHLQQAYQVLRTIVKQNPKGRMGQDVLSMSWKQLRLLERLSVPLGFYESEAESSWRLRTIRHGQETLGAFAQALQEATGLSSSLTQFTRKLEQAITEIDHHGPPHWNALTELCIADVESDSARLLLFSSDVQCQFFELGLLAYYNMSINDLATLNVTFLSARDFYGTGRRPWIGHPDREDLPDLLRNVPPEAWQLVIPGLPNPRLLAQLEPGLQAGVQLQFLIYSHQLPSLSWRLKQCIEALSVRAEDVIHTLSGLGILTDSLSVSNMPAPLRKMENSTIRLENKKKRIYSQVRSLPPAVLNPVEEMARLFEDDTELDQDKDDTTLFLDHNEDNSDEDSLLVDHAVEIIFQGGWYGLFAPDAKLNVIIQGSDSSLELRYVSSLRSGNHVLFIHGQRRQNLYELVVQRVHNHPAFALHVELVKHWQRDVAVAYRRWCQAGDRSRNITDLLAALQALGSSIAVSQTVEGWVQGLRLCPNDKEDLRRLAEVLNMDFVIQNYQLIFRAAERLRGKHRSWGRQLNHWLLHGTSSKSEVELFDEELGLSFGDLRGSLLHLHILTWQTVQIPVYHGNMVVIKKKQY